MKYIKKITSADMNQALLDAYYILPRNEFWEIKDIRARNFDYCYSTLDGSCFYYLDKITENFVYFALDKKVENIRGACEFLYELVCQGVPCIRINGIPGRYDLLKNIAHMKLEKTDGTDDRDYYTWYIAHPEDIEKLKKRINR